MSAMQRRPAARCNQGAGDRRTDQAAEVGTLHQEAGRRAHQLGPRRVHRQAGGTAHRAPRRSRPNRSPPAPGPQVGHAVDEDAGGAERHGDRCPPITAARAGHAAAGRRPRGFRHVHRRHQRRDDRAAVAVEKPRRSTCNVGRKPTIGEPAAGIGAEADRCRERPAAARHFRHLVQDRPPIGRLGIELVPRHGAQERAASMASDAADATSQTARMTSRQDTAAISIMAPAPAGMYESRSSWRDADRAAR